jgi:hypothetical protein
VMPSSLGSSTTSAVPFGSYGIVILFAWIYTFRQYSLLDDLQELAMVQLKKNQVDRAFRWFALNPAEKKTRLFLITQTLFLQDLKTNFILKPKTLFSFFFHLLFS